MRQHNRTARQRERQPAAYRQPFGLHLAAPVSSWRRQATPRGPVGIIGSAQRTCRPRTTPDTVSSATPLVGLSERPTREPRSRVAPSGGVLRSGSPALAGQHARRVVRPALAPSGRPRPHGHDARCETRSGAAAADAARRDDLDGKSRTAPAGEARRADCDQRSNPHNSVCGQHYAPRGTFPFPAGRRPRASNQAPQEGTSRLLANAEKKDFGRRNFLQRPAFFSLRLYAYDVRVANLARSVLAPPQSARENRPESVRIRSQPTRQTIAGAPRAGPVLPLTRFAAFRTRRLWARCSTAKSKPPDDTRAAGFVPRETTARTVL